MGISPSPPPMQSPPPKASLPPVGCRRWGRRNPWESPSLMGIAAGQGIAAAHGVAAAHVVAATPGTATAYGATIAHGVAPPPPPKAGNCRCPVPSRLAGAMTSSISSRHAGPSVSRPDPCPTMPLRNDARLVDVRECPEAMEIFLFALFPNTNQVPFLLIKHRCALGAHPNFGSVLAQVGRQSAKAECGSFPCACGGGPRLGAGWTTDAGEAR